jgi:hypothetical protein
MASETFIDALHDVELFLHVAVEIGAREAGAEAAAELAKRHYFGQARSRFGQFANYRTGWDKRSVGSGRMI